LFKGCMCPITLRLVCPRPKKRRYLSSNFMVPHHRFGFVIQKIICRGPFMV